ncbi:MAG: hypothetical protein NUV84_05340 [Candidatus Uhrbacteria bacterium]|nr:hypothetical protein [Candidatus Uhrbacteria bacterium]
MDRPTIALSFIVLSLLGIGSVTVNGMSIDDSIDCRDSVLASQLKTHFSQADQQTLDIVGFVLSGSREGILDWSSNDDCSIYQIALVTGRGERVTVYVMIIPKNPEFNWISFSTRPDGSSNVGEFSTFTDHDFNGVVDFGVNGNSNPKGDQYFRSAVEFGSAKGLKHQDVWQALLDQTVDDVHKALNL